MHTVHASMNDTAVKDMRYDAILCKLPELKSDLIYNPHTKKHINNNNNNTN